jgi:hypothetical protein
MSVSQLYLQTGVSIKSESFTLSTWPCQSPDQNRASIQQLLGISSPLWIITAWNPKSQLLALHENRERQLRLLSELEKSPFSFLEATASSISADWLEESIAIWVPEGKFEKPLEDLVLTLAEKYEQNALFKFHEDLQILVPVLVEEAAGSQVYCVNHCSISD